VFAVELSNGSPFSLITSTPIIISIPREKYVVYRINPKNNYHYVYWKAQYPIELFMSQLKDNLLKKYCEFSSYNKNALLLEKTFTSSDSCPFFQKFFFRKQVSMRIIMKGTVQTVIGTLWEFSFEGWEDKVRMYRQQ
jgi:CRISPR/Cas system endoribonuclease Cas6 (RAMP superfamily)